MSHAENKAVIHQVYDALNTSDLDRMANHVTADVAIHTPIPGIESGRDGFRQFIGIFLTAFPEQRTEVHELVAEGDRVAARHTHHVTHGGDFAGMPPTGKQASVTGIDLFRIRDGRVAEMWHQDDLLGLMQQLGAIPAPGAPGA